MSILSVDQMLANAQAAAAKGRSTAGMSKIQKMLAGREERDTVNLSPVAKLLQREAAKPKQVPYTEQDWYIQAKLNQLRAQLQIYSNLPGLDPSGAIMDTIDKEIREMAKKQLDTIKETQENAKKQQAKLAEADRLKALELPSVDNLLKKAKNAVAGKAESVPLSTEVQAMLDKIKKSTSTSA